ncbi:MAG: hypothetical protein GX896_01535 [Clostridiales bacterium]|nr:hypothetical protein [Clostridiales bacterium]
MNIKKRILLLLLVLTMVFSIPISTVQASNVDELPLSAQVSKTISYNNYGNVLEKLSLLNSNNQIIAYCLNFEKAYLIYDINGNVIEHCGEAQSIYNASNNCYYGGPLQYFEKANGAYINLNSQSAVPEEHFTELSNNFSESRKNITTFDYSPYYAETTKTFYTSGTPRTLNYNTKGTCGSLAATILLFYYHDYVYSPYVASGLVNSPRALHNVLIPLIEIGGVAGNGSSYTTLKNGINKYLSSVNLTQSATIIAKANVSSYGFTKIYNSNKPFILGLYSGSSSSTWAIDHWVVAYGVRSHYINDSLLTSREFIVNNGWGSNNVFITYNSSYIDGAVGI